MQTNFPFLLVTNEDLAVLDEHQTKTEGGKTFSHRAYAFVPDRDMPSTWKLKLFDEPGDVLLDEAQKDEWFGSFTVKIKKGVVRHVDKTEGLRPPSTKGNVVYT